MAMDNMVGFVYRVAPHWGAWIEIRETFGGTTDLETSHPTGVRGLKSRNASRLSRSIESHPTGVRGLKFRLAQQPAYRLASHPTGVRGLKFFRAAPNSPTGNPVAPHWGAWIEIPWCWTKKAKPPCRTPLGCVD